MDVTVDFYAGSRADEVPRRLHLGARTVEVAEVVDRWLEPEHRFFRLRGADGRLYLVRGDARGERWELAEPRG